MTTIGNKLKQLRKAKGWSQSDFAQKLGITSQAVSKWESDTSMPDILLLPDIAALFGIAIDDLFEYSKEKEYEKINHMIEYNRFLTNGEFLNAESFLLSELENNAENYDAMSMLAELYHFQAENLDQKAVHYGKMALSLRPNSKDNINTICKASGGRMNDWNTVNHRELIDYLYQVLREEPKNVRVYFYLLDNLMDAGRIHEAKKVLAESMEKNPDTLNEVYAIHIEELLGGFFSVKSQYEKLAEKYPKDWRVLFEIAGRFAYSEYYKEAICYWQQAFDVMEPPRYTDFYDAMAQCYIRLGDLKMAAETYRKEKKLLRDEWDIKYGVTIDLIEEKINNLA